MALTRSRKFPRKRMPWNKGKQIGRKLPLTARKIHWIQGRLKAGPKLREPALFDLAMDSSWCAIEVVPLCARDVTQSGPVLSRVRVTPAVTQRPLQYDLGARTHSDWAQWISQRKLAASHYRFPARLHASTCISVRQYARLIETGVASIGLDASRYGTESPRRSRPAPTYRRTRSLPAAQLMLQHVERVNTVYCLGKII